MGNLPPINGSIFGYAGAKSLLNSGLARFTPLKSENVSQYSVPLIFAGKLHRLVPADRPDKTLCHFSLVGGIVFHFAAPISGLEPMVRRKRFKKCKQKRN